MRPYDYLTDRSTVPTPGGPIKMLHTMELEPTPSSTTIHFRLGAPTTQREMTILREAGLAFEALFRESQRNPAARLEAAFAGQTDRGPEPELPMPRPDGVLAGIQPLRITG